MEREGIVKIAIPISVKLVSQARRFFLSGGVAGLRDYCETCMVVVSWVLTYLFSCLTAYMYMHYKSFNREPIASFPGPT